MDVQCLLCHEIEVFAAFLSNVITGEKIKVQNIQNSTRKLIDKADFFMIVPSPLNN